MDIDSSQDLMDSRDIIERLEELREMRESVESSGKVYEDEDLELSVLEELNTSGENATSDWVHGATLIRDDYFEDYARQLAEDLGAIDADAAWPACHIDWEAAATSLQMDYTSLEFEGVTYWVR